MPNLPEYWCQRGSERNPRLAKKEDQRFFPEARHQQKRKVSDAFRCYAVGKV